MKNRSTWDRRPRQDTETGLSTTEKAGRDSQERVGKGWKSSFSKAAGCKSGPRDGACRHGDGGGGGGGDTGPALGKKGEVVTPDRGGGRGVQACGDAGKGEATGPGTQTGRMVGRGESAGQATGRGEEGSNRKRARRPHSSLPAGRASSGDPSAPWTDPDTQPRKNPVPARRVLAIVWPPYHASR